MKTRMERMGIDPYTENGLEKLLSLSCVEIEDGVMPDIYSACPYKDKDIECERCMAKRLLKTDSKLVKRGMLYSDFNDAYVAFKREKANCGDTTDVQFANWLDEEIEVKN